MIIFYPRIYHSLALPAALLGLVSRNSKSYMSILILPSSKVEKKTSFPYFYPSILSIIYSRFDCNEKKLTEKNLLVVGILLDTACALTFQIIHFYTPYLLEQRKYSCFLSWKTLVFRKLRQIV